MLIKATSFAVGWVLLLATSVLAGEPIFDIKPGHPWDQARDSFYVRSFSSGEVFDNPHAFGPPWREYQPFIHEAVFNEHVVARLEALQKLPAAEMEEQPALRRLILLRDLWPVFDGLLGARVEIAGDAAATAKAVAIRDDLLRRIARIMQRLELTKQEVQAIPNAFATLRDQKVYPKEFDPASPETPFFPTDLLDPDGPWVAYSRDEAPSVGGKFHVDFVQHRSIFTLHLKAPQGREEAQKYLANFRAKEGKEPVPTGSTLALLRRALIPTRDGTLMPSPLVESLQMIHVTSGDDVRLKYTLDRRGLLNGKVSLTLLTADDPIDNAGFEAIVATRQISTMTAWRSIPPTESLVIEHYRTTAEMPKSIANCAKCHGTATRTNIFANFGAINAAYVQTKSDEVDATVVKAKEASDAWKAYLRLRTEPAK